MTNQKLGKVQQEWGETAMSGSQVQDSLKVTDNDILIQHSRGILKVHELSQLTFKTSVTENFKN